MDSTHPRFEHVSPIPQSEPLAITVPWKMENIAENKIEHMIIMQQQFAIVTTHFISINARVNRK